MKKNKQKKEKITFFNGTWIEEGILGAGSYGVVYKAKKTSFSVTSYSAIKRIEIPQTNTEVNTLKSEGLTKKEITEYYEDIVKRWIEEIEFMSYFKDSTTIVNIEDYEIIEKPKKSGYIIHIRMELLENIDNYILNNKVSDKTILKMAIDICQALEDCEKNDVLHRDIKPDNVFVNTKGVFKLGDFGIAKKVNGTLSNLSKKGTENYMAPELYKGEKGNRTVDIYSLGIMLYRFFNFNRLPYLPDYPQRISLESREEALSMRISGDKMNPPKNASRDIAEIILKACNYYPKNRYQTATELKKDLQEVYNGISKETILFNKELVVVPKEKIEYTAKTKEDETVSYFSTNIKKDKVKKNDVQVNDKQKEKNNEAFETSPEEVEIAEELKVEAIKKDVEKILTKEEKKSKNTLLKIIGIIVFLLLLIFIVVKLATGTSSEVKVPNMIGKEIEDVSDKLVELGLNYDLEYVEVENDEIGIVLEQSISPQEKVKVGTIIKIKVTVSKEKIKVPSVVGKSREEAEKILKDLGLIVSFKEEENSDIKKNNVISQTPVDEDVYIGSNVELVISLGKTETKKENESNTSVTPPKKESKWSEWTSSLPSNISSNSYYIEQKKQYRYSDKEIKTNSSSTLDGWIKYDESYTYSNWGNAKVTRNAVTESDTLQVTRKRTVYIYYAYINSYDGRYNVDSIAYGTNITLAWKDSYDNPLPGPTCIDGDQGGKRCQVYTGAATENSYGFTAWWLWGTKTEYTYQTRTKSKVYHFYRWKSWSDWQDATVSTNDNRKVETRTLYRYKQK